MRYILFTLLFFVLSTACKKKEEEKPYEPVKQKFTDIPGEDAYIANTDTAFVDTGLVITVKGKGFDPKYKDNYTLSTANFKVKYTYDNLPAEPRIISLDPSTIIFKYPKNYFGFDVEDCQKKILDFVLVKFSNDAVADMNYQKRFLTSSAPKKYSLKNCYEIIKDTAYLTKWTGYQADLFINLYSQGACDISIHVDNKYIASLDSSKTGITYSFENSCHTIGIPLDANYNIADGYHIIKLFKNGRELYRFGNKKGVFVKNVK